VVDLKRIYHNESDVPPIELPNLVDSLLYYEYSLSKYTTFNNFHIQCQISRFTCNIMSQPIKAALVV
jgi:hypothetical protein